MLKLHMSPLFLCLCFYLLSPFNVGITNAISKENPFTPKAYLIRYWYKEISNDSPKPQFLLSKASPLTATQSATYSKLASQSSLSENLPAFCSSANLLCFPDLSPSLEKHDSNVKFSPNSCFFCYGKGGGFSLGTYAKQSQDKPMMMSGKTVNKWVEPGKFFREAMLKEGTVMPMPDIRDKMPKRSFLPRVILTKLPFSSSRIKEMKKIFHARGNSSMEGMLADGLKECELAKGKDETKRCVGSAEDMIDFATSVLGRNIVVRTTENTAGSKHDVLIGPVKGINGGKVTKSVSCHQIMFPYLLYYCHSVPKVRVYEADILDTKTKNKINRGIAICHVDTSSWSAGYGAFVALGSKPGKIEVCHWIFENDMTWATAD